MAMIFPLEFKTELLFESHDELVKTYKSWYSVYSDNNSFKKQIEIILSNWFENNFENPVGLMVNDDSICCLFMDKDEMMRFKLKWL